MLDFNDAPPQRDDRPKLYDIEALKRGLAERAPDLIPQLFPRGRISSNGREWRTANTRGDPPKKDGSCVFTLTGPFAGYHQDWSTGEEGDQLATLGLVTGLAGRELFEHATEIIGTKAKSNGTSRCEPAKVDRTLDAQFTLRLCGLAVDTPVETYLNSRGLDLPPCDDIKFHPSLTDYDAKLGRPGMVAIVRDPETGKRLGIHRTYLADDGAAKADMAKPKMMLGPCGGGVVMLLPMTDDGVLGIRRGDRDQPLGRDDLRCSCMGCALG
jgi:putative DNA primase/helicase